jgi:hypothetical protein
LKFGTTFSEPYALALGVDPRAAFRAIAHEPELKVVRLCAYWDGIECEPGRFDFSSLEWQMEAAADAGLEIILTVGQKAPRWPEFYVPEWVGAGNRKREIGNRTFEEHLLGFIEATVVHFRGAPIAVWQVENEPYIAFGGARIEEGLLRREIDLVRSLDERPVMVTESAGKRDWRRVGRLGDVLGVNLYTRVWRRHWTNLWLGGYVNVGRPPEWYARRSREVKSGKSEIGNLRVGRVEDRSTKYEARSDGPEVMVAELQAEPWGRKTVWELTPEEAGETMSPERLRRNVGLAKEAGFETALLWGAEWWYWLRERGDASMWEAVRALCAT